MTIPLVRHPRRSFIAGTAVLLLACGQNAPAGGGPAQPAAAAAQEGAVELSEPVVVAGLSVALPSAWTRLSPRSSMRLLEAEMPGSAGKAEISAYFFGPGGGGGVAANIDRWKSQVVAPAGSAEVMPQSRESDGVVRTWVEIEGTVKASTTGSFPTADLPDGALYGAVVEGPGGPWYFRAVGPRETLREQRPAFLAMLESARPQG